MNENFNVAANVLCPSLRLIVTGVPDYVKNAAQEIRIRVNRPVTIVCHNETYAISERGNAIKFSMCQDTSNLLTVSCDDMINTMNLICNYSWHSHQHEIKNGFVTIPGGHRVGICGTAVIDNGSINTLRDISSINIRIARSIAGAGKEVASVLSKVHSGILVVGAPASGKTTVLRDAAKILSMQYEKKVSIVDERSEFFGVCGTRGMDELGMCDILNGYPKDVGIVQATRVLSPDVIVCDEIGTEEDARAIEFGMNAGVAIIASAHAYDMESVRKRNHIRHLIDIGAFDVAVILSSRYIPGTVSQIVNLK